MTKKQRLVSLAIEATYYLVIIGFLWYVSDNSRPPFRPWFWHTLMTTCHKVAATFGAVAIQAEVAYGAAMEKVRQ